jgi:predicted transcriptional regulator
VIEILQERGPLTQGELATVLGVTPQAVSIHLLRLRREAHVEKRNEGGQRRWMISSQDP